MANICLNKICVWFCSGHFIGCSDFLCPVLVCFVLSSDLKQLWARLADYLVLAKIRNALGFSSCQKHFCGAAPLHTETLYFFLGLNITLYEAYGMSETTGPHCLSGPYVYRQHR